MALFKVPLKNLLLLLVMIGCADCVRASTEYGNIDRKFYLRTTVKDGGDIASSGNPPPPPPPPEGRSNTAPFRPSIAVIVGVLTTVFSITFLLLIYAKHCRRGNGYSDNSGGRAPTASRKNSGVDRTVIESLPIFPFGSLRGEKEGLECAVCLHRFEPSELLRLLPKCKHAFHVECVDTWLDAHSTCPLCRYRVDPEDVLLVGADDKFLGQNEPLPPPPPSIQSLRRVSGRHSSAGERGTGDGFLEIVVEGPGASLSENCRDGSGGGEENNGPLTRRSLDSWNMRKNKKKTTETVSVGCFDGQPRKDELLLTTTDDRTSSERRRRLEHRIIISSASDGGARSGFHQRWSDVQPSDLLCMRSEMIRSDGRRLSASASGSSRPSASRRTDHRSHDELPLHQEEEEEEEEKESGKSVIKGRSVSEITGLSRFGKTRTSRNQQQEQEEQRQAGLVSRWLAWISHSHSQYSRSQPQTQQRLPAVQSSPTAS